MQKKQDLTGYWFLTTEVKEIQAENGINVKKRVFDIRPW